MLQRLILFEIDKDVLTHRNVFDNVLTSERKGLNIELLVSSKNLPEKEAPSKELSMSMQLGCIKN